MESKLSDLRKRTINLVREAQVHKLGPGPLLDEWLAMKAELLSTQSADLDALCPRMIDLMERIIATKGGK